MKYKLFELKIYFAVIYVPNLFCGDFSFQIYFAVIFVPNLFCGSIFLYITVLYSIGKCYIYDDDHYILSFEGIRLDMPKKNSWFEIELDYDATPDLYKVEQQTCCLIEVGLLPSTESAINIIWL